MQEASGLLVVLVVNLIVLGATLFGARRLGLTDVQRAVREETSLLVDRLKARVADVESENARLKLELGRVHEENRVLRERVDRLEQTLADEAVARRRRVPS